MSRNHFKPDYKPAAGDTLIALQEATRWSPLDTISVRILAVRRRYFDIEALPGGHIPHYVKTWEIERLIPESQVKGNCAFRSYSLFPDEAAYREHTENLKVIGQAKALMLDFVGSLSSRRITSAQARQIIAVLAPQK